MVVNMAIKQSIIIEDEVLNEKYRISGQTGIYDDSYVGDSIYLKEENRVNKFLLIDFDQLAIHITENCEQHWNNNKETYVTTEKDIDIYIDQVVKYINDGLFDKIKHHVLEEIEADEGETIALIRR